MSEMNLELTSDERDCLVQLLEHKLDEVKIEEHRTRGPNSRKPVLERERHIESILSKLKQWSEATH